MENLTKTNHLSIDKRLRLITLYQKNNLNFSRGRFKTLQKLAAKEDIIASETSLRSLVKKYNETSLYFT